MLWTLLYKVIYYHLVVDDIYIGGEASLWRLNKRVGKAVIFKRASPNNTADTPNVSVIHDCLLKCHIDKKYCFLFSFRF